MKMRLHEQDTTDVSDAVREAAEKLGEDLSRTARDAQAAAANFASTVRRSASEFASEANVRTRRAAHAVEENVRDHPVAWVAAAAGVGVLVGLLLTRRR